MKLISRRLEKLEKIFAPRVERESWGEMAKFRDQLLHLAEQRGTTPVAQLKEELDAMGPTGLWCETVRSYLGEHGFVQDPSESLAETTARALGIDGTEPRICMEQGRVGAALLDRFKQPGIATDKVS
jgi:hypothetical protein